MRPYLPSNGTEGMLFEDEWCDKCIKRAISPDAKTQCVHNGRAMAGDDNGKWYVVLGIPTCIAFKSRAESYKNRKPRSVRPDPNQRGLF